MSKGSMFGVSPARPISSDVVDANLIHVSFARSRSAEHRRCRTPDVGFVLHGRRLARTLPEMWAVSDIGNVAHGYYCPKEKILDVRYVPRQTLTLCMVMSDPYIVGGVGAKRNTNLSDTGGIRNADEFRNERCACR